MANGAPQEKPADKLEGLELDGGWTVVERVTRDARATGGTFSVGYIVRSGDGVRAFLKALDYSAALASPDPAKMLEALTTAYNYEREILSICQRHKMRRVVTALTDGKVRVDDSAAGVVQYLIFPLAEGDIRTFALATEAFDVAWALRSLHEVAVGLWQMHKAGLAHHDLKPSNVLSFDSDGMAIADLGRAVSRIPIGPQPYFLKDDFPGDTTYAPPELLYAHVPTDWDRHHLGSDAYQLGSLAIHLVLGTGLTPLLLARLPAEMHWTRWKGKYSEILPVLRSQFARILSDLEGMVPEHVAADLRLIVEQLCDPDPDLRGHPRNRREGKSPLNLERYVSRLDLLAQRSEWRLRKP